MATDIENIDTQKGNAVEILDTKISEAIRIKGDLSLDSPQRPDLSAVINDLMTTRTQLHIQTLKAALESAQLAAALIAITEATQALKTEADRMKNATSFIGKANTVIGAATKVANVLKNGG